MAANFTIHGSTGIAQSESGRLQVFHAGSIPAARSSFPLPGTPGFAAGRITALAAFLFEVSMFDIDFRRMIITLVLAGALIGGAIVALVMVAWPWLWAMAKPALHAVTA